MSNALPGESAGKGPDAAQQLRDEIEHTRDALGDTVAQLSAKVDVKSRARAQISAARQAVSKGVGFAGKQWVPFSAAAGAVLAIAALAIWQRRR
jgi:hypothetical protein